MKKILIAIVSALLCVGLTATFAGCGKTNTVTVTGSSSVSPVMKELAAAYEKSHSGVRIVVATSDSSAGITDTQEGKNDFGMASRGLKSGETGVKSVKICDDGVVLVVNKNETLTDVTSDEVYKLYKDGTAIGSITKAISREDGSGTRDAFDGLIKGADGKKLSSVTAFSSAVSIQNSTGNVKTEVASTMATMGYISMGALDDTVKALTFNGVEGNAANVKNGTYTLARPFNVIVKEGADLSKEAQSFLDFILSEEGQTIVSKNYIRL